MTSSVSTSTGHEDSVHDAQLDYYGLRLATCSSDHTVKIFDVVSHQGAQPQLVHSCNLLGHTGPVWQVAWAHPRFGALLASCSYDANVILHRQNQHTGVWEEEYRYTANSSVNAIQFCPIEYGLAVALGSSDGTVAVLRQVGATEWQVECAFLADRLGVNSVSWAPFGALGSVDPVTGAAVLRLACAGGDETIKLFRCDFQDSSAAYWHGDRPEFTLQGHTGAVRDVAFCPSVGLPYNLLASCGDDGHVKLWEQQQGTEWTAQDLKTNGGGPVWRVAWSVSGSILAVSGGGEEEGVTLWKESAQEKKWVQVKDVVKEVEEQAPVGAPAVAAVVSIESKPDQFLPEEEDEEEEEEEEEEEDEEEEDEEEEETAAVAPPQEEASAWVQVPEATETAPAAQEQAAAWDQQQQEGGAASWDQQQQDGGQWDQPQQQEEGAAAWDQQQGQWDQQQGEWDQQQQWDPQQGQWDPQQQQGEWDQQGQQQWDPQQGEWDQQQEPVEWTPEQIAAWEQQQQQQQGQQQWS